MLKLKLFSLCLTACICVAAQERSKAKFGDVSVSDLSVRYYSIDSTAAAVVIADIGSCSFKGNSKGWFSLIFHHYRRVHILNKNGFGLANVAISLYRDGQYEEKIDKFKAITYNLENGKVVESR